LIREMMLSGAGEPALEAECRLFTRVLVSGSPDAYITRKYIEAHRVGDDYLPHGTFDRILLSLAGRGAWAARIADAHARLFSPSAVLRKKLILLLAILETSAPYYRRIDEPGRGGWFVLPLRLAFAGLRAAVLLIAGGLLLLPVQFVCRLSGRD
jgi:hypothetical protein